MDIWTTLIGVVVGAAVTFLVTKWQIVKLVEQLETSKRQLDVDAVGMTSHELEAIDEVLIQYPKFRPCFYDGVDPNELSNITNNDKEMIKAIAARLVNGYATILLQSRVKVESSIKDQSNMIPAAWARATIARRYGNSPPCCDHLMTYIEEYDYTGRHQITLMFDGLDQALNAALERKDKKRAKQLRARIQAAEALRASLYKRIDENHTLYKGREMPVLRQQ
jgi:hypothetical protein